MKVQFAISMMLLMGSIHAQQCDPSAGEMVNCADSAGLKQGRWLEGRKEVRVKVHSGYGSKGGCQYHEDFSWIILAEGYYADGLRIGTWSYYDDVPHRHGELRYRLEFGAEETLIGGEVFHKGNVVKLSCANGGCLFHSIGEPGDVAFALSDLDFELTRLTTGAHDRALGITRRNER